MGDRLEARALARARVRAMRRRARVIRRKTAWLAFAFFAATWVVIFGQLVSGHDPALARKRVAAAPAVVATAPPRHARHHARRHVRRARRHPTAVQPAAGVPATAAPAATPASATAPSAPAPAPQPAPAPAPVVTSQS